MIMERSARADSVSPKSPSPKPNGEAFLDRASSFTSCDTPTSQKKKADAEVIEHVCTWLLSCCAA